MQSDEIRLVESLEQSIRMVDGKVCNSTLSSAIKLEANASYNPVFQSEKWKWKDRNIFYLYNKETADKVTEEGKKILKNMEKELEEMLDAAQVAGLAMGMEPISKEDYDRFWKWMMVPLKDVPDDELIWCYKQDRQNSICSKSVWKSEIVRRNLLNKIQ